MNSKGVLILFIAFCGLQSFGQTTTRIIPPHVKEVRYAEISGNAKWLVVSQEYDTIRILDSKSLQEVRNIPMVNSGNTLNVGHPTGKKEFHITTGNQLIYISRVLSKDSASLFLQSQDIATGKINFSSFLLRYHSSDYFAPSLSDIHVSYGLSSAANHILLSIENQVYEFDEDTGKLFRKWKIENVEQAALSLKNNWLALACGDSLKILNIEINQTVFETKLEVGGVCFVNDSILASYGKDVFLFNVKRRKFIDTVFHLLERVRHLTPGTNQIFTLSGEPTSLQNNFTASYGLRGLPYRGVFHLPENMGFISFFHPNGDLWTITVDGRLFRFPMSPSSSPRPISQRGHNKAMKSFSFSKDKRYMLSAEDGGDILLWDVQTGRTMERYTTNESLLSNAIFAEDDRDILYDGFEGFKRIHRQIPSNVEWGLPFNVFLDEASKKYLSSYHEKEKVEDLECATWAARYSTDTEYTDAYSKKYFVGIVKVEYTDHLRAVNLDTREVEDHPLPDNLMSFSFSPLAFYDDHTVVFRGAQNTIVFYDLISHQVARRLGKKSENLGQLFNGTQKIIFSPGGDTLFTVTNQRIIQGWNLKNGERLFRQEINMKGFYQENALDYQKGYLTLFSQAPNISFLAAIHVKTGFAKMIAYTDTAFRQSHAQFVAIAHKAKGFPTKVSLSPDGTQLLLVRMNIPSNNVCEVYVDLWNMKTLTLISSVPVPDLSFTEWTVSWKENMLAIWDTNATNAAEQKKMIAAFGENSLGGANTYPGIKILNFVTGKFQELNLDKLKIVRAGQVRFANKNEIWLRDDFKSKLHRVTLDTKKIVTTVNVNGGDLVGSVGDFYSASDSTLFYSLIPDSFSPATEVGKFSFTKNQKLAQSSTAGVEIMCMSEPHKSGVIAIGLSDQSISMRDTKTLEEKYRIVQDEVGNYIFITPDNYYMANRASARALYFNWNYKSFALSQFDAWFNRPDKVLKATGFMDQEQLDLLEKAYKKRARQVGEQNLTTTIFQSMPTLKIKNTHELPLQVNQDFVNLEMEATSETSLLQSWQLLVNGVPFFENPGRKIEQKNSFTEKIKLPLLVGENKIKITSLNVKGVESLPDEITISRLGAEEKPNLYLATVAINRYQNESFNLKYAVKDARDIIRSFSTSDQFGQVFIDSVFNDQVNLENVKKLKQKLSAARPQDVVILFFAGHGMLDENFDFRFAAWNVDMNRPSETGMLYDDLEKILDGIPCRNKLMLVDACHSGQVDKDEIRATAEELVSKQQAEGRVIKKSFNAIQQNVFKAGMIDRRGFELMQEIFYGLGSTTGSQVVVATAGDSYAQESAQWNNGVFTYALLNGLQSGEADLNRDQKVSTDELVNYLRDTVKGLTDGNQVPRFREENLDNHFVVWDYKK